MDIELWVRRCFGYEVTTNFCVTSPPATNITPIEITENLCQVSTTAKSEKNQQTKEINSARTIDVTRATTGTQQQTPQWGTAD